MKTMKRKFFRSALVLAAAVMAGVFAAGCDRYDEVPPKNSGQSYDLLPIVGTAPTDAELVEWRAIRAEYDAHVEK